MQRILVGIDGSKESRDAAQFALKLAEATGAHVTFASVVYIQSSALGPQDLELRVARWEAEETAHAKKLLDDVAKELGVAGKVETVVKNGPPADVLADLAQAGDADMVVVGHRGRGLIKRMLTGSVAQRLVQICSKPVTVVR